MSHKFHHTVLREYDIRGIIGETLSTDDAVAIGRALGSDVGRNGGRSICVGYDGRLSSPDLEAGLVEGLTSTGLEVRRIGRGPTPMLYFATKDSGADAGIMVTGSHNPPNHNGFKMMLKDRAFFGPDIQRLGTIAAAGDYLSGSGRAVDLPIAERYLARLVDDYSGPADEGPTVVWDAGNGAAGEMMAALAARLPGRHILLNEKIDGTFPAHHPDPTEPENLVQLQDTVLAEGADLGIAFDGDGDRIGIIDGQGRILWGDQILLILAEEILAAQPGATIIADVKASQVLFDGIAALGGKPLMWRTGHSLIKTKLVETSSPLAGEMSGHIFFADRYYGFDDALYAAVRFLGIVARSTDETLAQRHDRIPKMVNTPELRFPCADERKFSVIEEVKQRLKASGAQVNDIDGVRVNTDQGWWLLRASNTQAVLVARREAANENDLEVLKDAVDAQLKASGLSMPSHD